MPHEIVSSCDSLCREIFSGFCKYSGGANLVVCMIDIGLTSGWNDRFNTHEVVITTSCVLSKENELVLWKYKKILWNINYISAKYFHMSEITLQHWLSKRVL